MRSEPSRGAVEAAALPCSTMSSSWIFFVLLVIVLVLNGCMWIFFCASILLFFCLYARMMKCLTILLASLFLLVTECAFWMCFTTSLCICIPGCWSELSLRPCFRSGAAATTPVICCFALDE